MIPNIVHFVNLVGESKKPWQMHHYFAVKSALVNSKFEKATIWVDKHPGGEWWEATKKLPNVYINAVVPPTEIFGKPITQPAHQSDVLRLQILIDQGGVYADTDTIFVKPFDILFNEKFVLGQQGPNGVEGLCPAIIASEKDATFGKHWLSGFQESFMGGAPGTNGWCTHSVIYPAWLAERMPNEISIANYQAFFWPLYHTDHMKALFEDEYPFPNAYSHHLWESSGKEYLNNITLEDIRTKRTTYNNLVRHLIDE